MYRNTFISLLILFVSLSFITTLNAQQTSKDSILIKEANLMGQALIKGDYKTFIKYNPKELVEASGGIEKYESVIKQQYEQLKNEGNLEISNTNYTVSVSPIFDKKSNSYQAFLRQRIFMKMKGKGTLISESNMIAIKPTGAKNWYFMEYKDKTKPILLRLYDNIIDDSSLKPVGQPILVPEY
ncbi:hypothetical protein EP331_13420 [bacterium]|nr:MAG: hypothetical protein EP331_13420 [bacterium]